MRSMLKILFILVVLFQPIESFAFQPSSKIGSNILNFIALNDVNLAYEQTFADKVSFLIGVHYFASGVFQSWKTDVRVSGAIRIYADSTFQGFPFLTSTSNIEQKTKNSLVGCFLESRVSLTRLDGNLTPSLEFGIGATDIFFNQFMFYEYKLGAARFFNSDKVFPMGSISVGILF